MTFLDAVNRILRIEGFIRGDSDTLASFSDTAHNSSSSLAQIAVQNEISELAGRGLLPYQHVEQATIALATATRTYSLPSNFIQMWGDPSFFYDSTQNVQIMPFPGGENQLRNEIMTYRTDAGYPIWFYFPDGVTRTVAFYPVPDLSVNGKLFYYDYSSSVNVSAASDTIPLTTTDQQYAFCDMAGRRFKFIYEGKTAQAMDDDPVYKEARARFFNLLKNRQSVSHYGHNYMSSTLQRF